MHVGEWYSLNQFESSPTFACRGQTKQQNGSPKQAFWASHQISPPRNKFSGLTYLRWFWGDKNLTTLLHWLQKANEMAKMQKTFIFFLVVVLWIIVVFIINVVSVAGIEIVIAVSIINVAIYMLQHHHRNDPLHLKSIYSKNRYSGIDAKALEARQHCVRPNLWWWWQWWQWWWWWPRWQ